jgi:hypothetical protein
MDYLLPLTTFERQNPDFSGADRLQEVAAFIQRQRAIARCLDGLESPDVVLDLLDSQGLDPIAYVDEVEAAVELVIVQSLPVSLWR